MLGGHDVLRRFLFYFLTLNEFSSETTNVIQIMKGLGDDHQTRVFSFPSNCKNCGSGIPAHGWSTWATIRRTPDDDRRSNEGQTAESKVIQKSGLRKGNRTIHVMCRPNTNIDSSASVASYTGRASENVI